MWLIRLAWRNLWRNTRRTVITVGALTLGVTAIVVLQSFQEVTFTRMIQTVTSGLIGDLQIHARGYQESPELGNVIRHPAQVEAVIAGKLPGAVEERRVVGAGLAGVEDRAGPAMVMGVEPEATSSLRKVVSGTDLAASPSRQAVIGAGLAETLGARVGSELVIVGQAADGSVANDRYTVVGLATTDSSDMDRRAVFLHLKDAQDLFGLGDGVHQIVVRLPGGDEDLAQPLSLARGALDLTTLEALSWAQIVPELNGVIAEKRKGIKVLGAIVFLIVALGVLNTMTMSTFERTREFGVMASLGTRPGRVLGLVVTEAVLQGLLGLVLGVGIAALVLYGLGSADTPISGQDVLGFRMPSGLQLGVQWVAVRTAAVTALLTVVVGGLVPAWRASRLRPADAARSA